MDLFTVSALVSLIDKTNSQSPALKHENFAWRTTSSVKTIQRSGTGRRERDATLRRTKVTNDQKLTKIYAKIRGTVSKGCRSLANFPTL